MQTKLCGLLLGAILIIAGCSVVEKAEHGLFTIQTNYVESVTAGPGGVRTTNLVPVKVYVTKPAVEGTIRTGGGVASMIWPPAGWIATALVGALGVWAKIRSRKVSEALVQGTEVLREVIKTFPAGAKVDKAVVDTLVRNQKAAGVHEDIKKLTPNVDGREAVADAKDIRKESVLTS